MGIAAYNRGSRAIREQIDAETKGKPTFIAYEPKWTPDVEPAPQKGVLGYWNLTQDPSFVKVGDRVYCTVFACRGWDEVTAVKGARNDLRIKTLMNCPRKWAYAHNFTHEPPPWMLRSTL
jgi:hypothetical protein